MNGRLNATKASGMACIKAWFLQNFFKYLFFPMERESGTWLEFYKLEVLIKIPFEYVLQWFR